MFRETLKLTPFTGHATGGGDLPYKKERVLVRNFEKNFRESSTKMVFCELGLNFFFTLKRYQLQDSVLPAIFWVLNISKGMAKALTVDLSEVKQPKRYQKCLFFFLDRHNKHPLVVLALLSFTSITCGSSPDITGDNFHGNKIILLLSVTMTINDYPTFQ